MNDDAFSYPVPKIVTVPADCGRAPLIEQLDFVVTQVPDNVDPLTLVEFDHQQKRVKWSKTTDLNLID